APGAAFTIGGGGAKTLADGRTLENDGTITWPTGSIGTDQGASFVNASGGLVDIQGNGQIFVVSGQRGSVVNAPGATFRKTAGNVESLFDVELDNGGTLDV